MCASFTSSASLSSTVVLALESFDDSGGSGGGTLTEDFDSRSHEDEYSHPNLSEPTLFNFDFVFLLRCLYVAQELVNIRAAILNLGTPQRTRL